MRRQKPSMLIVEVPHAITPSNTRLFEHAVMMCSAGLFTLQDPPREKSFDNRFKLVRKH